MMVMVLDANKDRSDKQATEVISIELLAIMRAT